MVLASAIAACCLAASPASPQEPRDGDPVSIGAFRLLHSDVLDEDRTLLVCLPKDYGEAGMSYPVLYVLYGGQIRGYFAEAVHIVDRLSEEGSMPKMIVVGVENLDRYRDLSALGRPGMPSGIEPFSRFVTEELLPFVEREYRTKDYRVLIGPQAGAEFGFYTLAKRPGLFDAFILENPFRSDQVHDMLVEMMSSLLEEGLPSFTFVQITASDRAGPLDTTEQAGYMHAFDELVEENDPHNLTLITHYMEDSQDFLPLLKVREALRELFREYRFPGDREVRGLPDITSHYSALSERFGFEVDVPEMTLYMKADELSKMSADDSAREILDYLIEAYPTSVSGHWGLANLHREMGNREQALEHYRKCVELMPNMRPATQWIERLEAEE
jgi:hypothetical protein